MTRKRDLCLLVGAIAIVAVSAFAIDAYKGGSIIDSAVPVDQWMDEAGDTAAGDFNWGGYDIVNIGDLVVVGTAALPVGSIDATELAAGSVGTSEIIDGSIAPADLGDIDLEDLDDVLAYLGVLDTGDTIIWNGSIWTYAALPTELGDLDNVHLTSPLPDAILHYVGGYWVDDAFGDVFDLADLGNVAGTSPATGNLLRWSGSAWAPSNTLPTHAHTVTDITLALDGLSDVDTTGVVNGQTIVYSSGTWVDGRPSYAIDDLSDVSAAAPIANEAILVYSTGAAAWTDATAETWLTLAELQDVDYSGTPTDGYVLTWDTGSSAWRPEVAAAVGPMALDDLTDVDAAAPGNRDVLAYDAGSTDWIPVALLLGGIGDVDVAGVADGQVLAYDDGTATWVPADDAVGDLLALDDLTDVDVSGVSDGDYLAYDDVTGWGPAAAPAPTDIWLDEAGDTLAGWLVGGGYGLAYVDGTGARFGFHGTGQVSITGDSSATYIREQTAGQFDVAGGLRVLTGGLRLKEATTPTVGAGEGMLYVEASVYEDLYFKDDRQDATQLTNQGKIAALRSVEGVRNDGGNIDLVPGTGIAISGSDVANTITISSSAFALSGLTDVDDSLSPIAGQVLKFDGAEWTADDDDTTVGSVTNRLDLLDDVEITGVADDEILIFDATSTNWINRVLLAADIPAHASTHAEGGSDEIDLSTWELGDIGDVTINPVLIDTNDVLAWNGAGWFPLTLTIEVLGDVDLEGPIADGSFMTWDSGSSVWTNIEFTAGMIPAHADTHEPGGSDEIDLSEWELAGLGDVDDAISPTTNQVLKWDGAEWTAGVDMGLTTVALDDLSNVVITTPAANSVLIYSGGSWIDATAIPAAALPTHASTHSEGGTDALVMSTWEIEDLGNVDDPAADEDDVLAWDGDSWVATRTSLDWIYDVNISSVADEDLLTYEPGSGWVNQGFDEYVINDLGDVDTAGVALNNVLRYTGAPGPAAWAPVNPNSLVTDLWLNTAGDTATGDLLGGAGVDIILDATGTFAWSGGTEVALDGTDWEFNSDGLDVVFDEQGEFTVNSDINIVSSTGEMELSIRDGAARGVDIDVSASKLELVAASLTTLDLSDWTSVSLANGVVDRAEIGTFNLQQLSNANLGSVADGQGIAWNAGAGKWDPVTLGGGIPDGTSTDDILYWTGAAWDDVGFDHFVLSDLGNVSATAPTLNYVLKWSGSAWAPAPDVSSSSMYLNDLLDVTATAPAAGYLMYYKDGTDKWQIRGEWFVDVAGDTMSGNLDMDSNDIEAVDDLEAFNIDMIDSAGAYIGMGDRGTVYWGSGQDYAMAISGGDIQLSGTLGYFKVSGLDGIEAATAGGNGMYLTPGTPISYISPEGTSTTLGLADWTDVALAAGVVSRTEIGTFNAEQLSDVQITAKATGDILQWNGSKWVDQPLTSLDDIGGVVFTPPLAHGQLIQYVTDHWENVDPESMLELADMSDVDDALAPTTNQVLTYDGAEWVAADAATVTDLNSLSNVTITNPGVPGPLEVLAYSGGEWIDYTLVGTDLPAHASRHSEGGTDALSFDSWEIEDLNEVGSTTKPTAGADPHVLKWVGGGTEWNNAVLALTELDTVTITTPATGQLLRYNGSAWVNYTLLNTDIPTHGSRHAENGADPISLATFEAIDLGDILEGGAAVAGDVLQWDGNSWEGEQTSVAWLGDTTFTSLAANEIMYWSGSAWVDGALPLASLPAHTSTHSEGGSDALALSTFDADDLGDITYSTAPTNGQVLKWDTDHWEPDTDLTTETGLYLDDLTNVVDWDDAMELVIYPGSLADGDVLKYHASSNEFRNQAFAHTSTHAEGGTDASFFGTYEIDDLYDVGSTTKPTAGQDPHLLKWAGGATEWTNASVALSELSNVDATAATTGYALVYGASSWGPAKYAIANLNNVNLTGALSGDFLRYDGSNWVDDTLTDTDLPTHHTRHEKGGTDAISLETFGIADLGDVYNSISPSDGQVLTYDTVNGWQAEDAASGTLPAGTDGYLLQYSTEEDPDAWVAVDTIAIDSGQSLTFGGDGKIEIDTYEGVDISANSYIRFVDGIDTVQIELASSALIFTCSTPPDIELDLSQFGSIVMPAYADQIVLAPLYANGIAGAQVNGTLTTGIEEVGSPTYTVTPYYKWAGSLGSRTSVDIWITVALPSDFVEFGDPWLTVAIKTSSTDAGASRVQLKAHMDGTDAEDLDYAASSVAGTWDTIEVRDTGVAIDDGRAGLDVMHFLIRLESESGEYAMAGNVTLDFTRSGATP